MCLARNPVDILARSFESTDASVPKEIDTMSSSMPFVQVISADNPTVHLHTIQLPEDAESALEVEIESCETFCHLCRLQAGTAPGSQLICQKSFRR